MSASFPRLYAAASLKRRWRADEALEVSGVFRGFMPRPHWSAIVMPHEVNKAQRFPRLYAAASLKHIEAVMEDTPGARFSAALCRGLIEASRRVQSNSGSP